MPGATTIKKNAFQPQAPPQAPRFYFPSGMSCTPVTPRWPKPLRKKLGQDLREGTIGPGMHEAPPGVTPKVKPRKEVAIRGFSSHSRAAEESLSPLIPTVQAPLTRPRAAG